MAGKVWGRLEFCCTPMFGRFGRAKLRPFSRRQHENLRFWLNHQLTSSLKWWLEILSCSPPRLVPTHLSERHTNVSCSDGEGSKAGVGVASWKNGTQVVRAGVHRVPGEVRMLWDGQKKLGCFNGIFEIEAVGPLVLLENFPDLFQGSLWLHFLDNAAALSNLINGSSFVTQGDILIGATWSQVQSLQVFPWFDRVDSKSNPVDGLSRGQLDGPWKVESLAFPEFFLRALRQELGWREGSQANTLLALLIREGGSTSEHRIGLCAVVLVPHVYLGSTASDLGCVGDCLNR